MELSALLQDYVRYNLWANTLITDWLYSQSMHLLERKTPSSFPSLSSTLLHIWDAEQIWMGRLQGQEATTFPSMNFNGNLGDLRQGLISTSTAYVEFVQNCPEAFFQQKIRYRNTKGQTFETATSEVILHCTQHSTYHRGQLVTMARSLGMTDPPQTDYIAYLRMKTGPAN